MSATPESAEAKRQPLFSPWSLIKNRKCTGWTRALAQWGFANHTRDHAKLLPLEDCVNLGMISLSTRILGHGRNPRLKQTAWAEAGNPAVHTIHKCTTRCGHTCPLSFVATIDNSVRPGCCIFSCLTVMEVTISGALLFLSVLLIRDVRYPYNGNYQSRNPSGTVLSYNAITPWTIVHRVCLLVCQ